MALSPGVYANLLRRALSIIGGEAVEGGTTNKLTYKGVTSSRVFEILAPRARSLPGYNGSEFRALTRRAIEAANAGALTRETPEVGPDPGTLPSIPRVEIEQPPYRSDVVFEIRTPLGKIDQGRVTIDSQTPLSQNEAQEIVTQNIDRNRTPNRSGKAAPFVMPDDATVAVKIIGAYRVL